MVHVPVQCLLTGVYQCQCASVPFSRYYKNDGSWRYQVTKSPVLGRLDVKDITVPGPFLMTTSMVAYRGLPWGADGCFLKWWVSPTTMGFPTKNDHFGVWNGGTTILENPQINPSQASKMRKFWYLWSWISSQIFFIAWRHLWIHGYST